MDELRRLIQQWFDLQSYYKNTYGECNTYIGGTQCYGEWDNLVMAYDIDRAESGIINSLVENKKDIAIYNGYIFINEGRILLIREPQDIINLNG